MADINLTVYMTVKKANAVNIRSHDAISTASLQKTLTGNAGASFTQLIPSASDVAIAFPTDIGTARRVLLENKDASNPVTLSIGTGGAFAAGKLGKLEAGEPMYWDPDGVTIYAQATGADVRIQITACPA